MGYALKILDDYDYKTISKPNGTINNKRIIYKDCIDIINKLKSNINSDLFALERDKELKSIINDIYQTFNEKDLYSSIEEKLLTFCI